MHILDTAYFVTFNILKCYVTTVVWLMILMLKIAGASLIITKYQETPELNYLAFLVKCIHIQGQ